jgi:hypothetical protein
MTKQYDPKEGFQSYLNEIENYGMRWERLYAEFNAGMSHKRLEEWLEAAYKCGARDMANDTLDTLRIYGTAVAGLNDKLYNGTEAFDRSADNLEDYYGLIFKEEK